MTPQVKQRIEQIRRGEVPEGYKKTKVGIVPMEWVYEKLDQYLISHREVSEYSNQYPVLTSSRKGIFLQSEYYTREVASEDNTGYNVVPRGYFTYRHMSDDEIFKFNINTLVDRGIVSTLYPVFTTKNINDHFLQAVLNEGREFRRFAILQKQGGSRTYMYFDKLKKLKICMPTLLEQKKISEILSVQDKLITLKEKLIEEKKRQKISIADKLFSPEYIKQKSPLANKTSFAKICSVVTDYVSNGSFKSLKDNVEYLEQGYAVLLRLADYNNGFDKNKFIYVNEKAFNFLSRSIVYPNDIIIANVGSVGAVFRAPDLKMPMSLAPNTILVRTNISNDYFYHFVCSTRGQDLLKTITSTTAQPKFNKTDFKGLEMLVPNVDTQKNTSQILNLVDKEIEILKKDLDQEKQKKKALMQLLLTGIVRV